MVKNRKVKVYGRIKLYETSAVGIPAYPNAHFSADDYSLIKSVSKSFVDETEEIKTNEVCDTIKFTEEVKIMETIQEQTPAIAKTEKEVKATEVVKSETVEKKEDMSEIISKALKEAIKEGFKEMTVERGLTAEKQTVPKVKSMGELALEAGLFKLH